jgi:formylglycine-generating enzyme required for sulfatase activity
VTSMPGRLVYEWLPIEGNVAELHGFGRAVLEPFSIARLPVSEAQFDEFLSADDGYGQGKWWKSIPDGRDSPAELALGRVDFPRVSVSWYDCVAYARWDSERSGVMTRLPNEWEWVCAVTSSSAGRYPWGDHFDPSMCNTKECGIGGVASLNRPRMDELSLVDTFGNVWERCLGEYGNPSIVGVQSIANRAIRGGSWNFSRREAVVQHRQVCVSSRRFTDGGFRIIRTNEASDPHVIAVDTSTLDAHRARKD